MTKYKVKCNECEKFLNKSMLKDHIQRRHTANTSKTFACRLCDKGFLTKGELKQHMKYHDKDQPKPYHCDQCDYKTALNIY